MLHMLAATLLTFLALPALAVTPQAGDYFFIESSPEARLVHIGKVGGATTVVSCWDGCAVPIGTGPSPFPYQWNPVVGADGAVYFAGSTAINSGIYRVDLATGNRELVTEIGFGGIVVWPAPNFFPSTVASLGGWGLATLVLGIVIGVQVRARMSAM